ncbi:hypothetical protein HYW74_03865 [Candidatus Pacearchaeota archaeon]|nr:hypothetical protein [Candidatus Pacearchaeota archaeon]
MNRTGKEYREVHEWINEENWKEKHDLINIPKFLPIVKKELWHDGVEEYLIHLK